MSDNLISDNFIDQQYGIGIRRLRVEDIEPYQEAASTSAPEAYQFMPWCHPNYSINESKHFIESQIDLWDKGLSFGFSIYHLESDALIGAVEIAHPNWQENYGDLGYWMRSSEVGKGYTAAGARLAVRFAFEELKIAYLRIYCLPENMPSRRIAVKLGAKFDSKVADFIWIAGESREAIYYRLIEKSFLKTVPLK
jgi:ribosomal-protein-serine acetyltransferase